jgi:hypothetical protein
MNGIRSVRRVGGAGNRGKQMAKVQCSSPSPRSYVERVGLRGRFHAFGLAESPPHPALRADLSPQAGRGEEKSYGDTLGA